MIYFFTQMIILKVPIHLFYLSLTPTVRNLGVTTALTSLFPEVQTQNNHVASKDGTN